MVKLTKEEHLQAIKDGVKEAFLTAMEAGDGYTGPIILEPILKAIQDGTAEGIFSWEQSKEINHTYANNIGEKLLDSIENLSDAVSGLSTEFYKYRMDEDLKNPNSTKIWT